VPPPPLPHIPPPLQLFLNVLSSTLRRQLARKSEGGDDSDELNQVASDSTASTVQAAQLETPVKPKVTRTPPRLHSRGLAADAWRVIAGAEAAV
jgi:hypothetical protein